MEDLLWQSARQTAQLIRERSISAVEVMNAHYDQIETLNPTLNAIVNLLPRERALALAEVADNTINKGVEVGPLHGIPMAPKDMIDVRGFPTTQGFVPFANRVAATDCALVDRQRRAGAVMIGKTNLPEFALGSHTFNELFGVTRNPYDHGRSAGGSSGGAAAALASGMLSVADGSDMGGSLRNPAAFCNVVGFRPSIGRVPNERGFGWLGRLGTAGPMARTVRDAAWLFSVQAGPFSGDPLTLPEPGSVFQDIPRINLSGKRVAMTEDLNLVPVDSEIRQMMKAAGQTLETLGAHVEVACPDMSEAMDVFQTLRAANLSATGRVLDKTVPNWRDHAKDTAIWNIEKGFALTADEIITAELKRTEIFRHVSAFFEDFDLLILPSAQVPPFPVEMHWVEEIEGQKLATYIDWMTVCCAISVTGLPAISVPGGFTTSGLPMGVQLVAGARQDLALLAMAQCFEEATGFGTRRPGAT